MLPSLYTLPYNYSASLSFGDQTEILSNPLGYTLSLTYSKSASNYTNGDLGRWQLIGSLDQSEGLTNLFSLRDQKSQISVDIGLLAGLSYKIGTHTKISTNFLSTLSGQHGARYITGTWTEEYPDRVYQSSVIQYIERSLNSIQFAGKHNITPLLNSTIDWKYSIATNTQNEPDLRFLTYLIDNSIPELPSLGIPSSGLQRPARFFRDLDETNNNIQFDYTVPLEFFEFNGGKIKAGYYGQTIEREFNENRFEYGIANTVPLTDYQDDINSFFNLLGIIDSSQVGSKMRYTFGNTLNDNTNDKNQYKAEKNITAYYLMVELPVLSNLKLIGGIRAENTDMLIQSADTLQTPGKLDNNDLLPAVSFIYNLSENLNIRASYTNTIARPTFRELAPYTTFDFVGDFIFTGNADLKRTLIKNSDFRVEWFPNAGEIIAFSGFYKEMENFQRLENSPMEKYPN